MIRPLQAVTNFFMPQAWSHSGNGAQYYDALKVQDKRRAWSPMRPKNADDKLSDRDRRLLAAKAAMSYDNFAIAAWMVRTHLNHVAALTFKAQTPNEQLNDQIEQWLEGWSSRFSCHAQRKHCFRDLCRMMEARRILDGDVFALKVGGDSMLRGSIQLIEADRVATPGDDPESPMTNDERASWVNGVKLSAQGIATRYAVHRRSDSGQLQLERFVRADAMVHHGIFDRPDQVRGISPLTSAINPLSDLYESLDYLHAKLKLAALMGVYIVREPGWGGHPGRYTTDGDGDGIPDSNHTVDLPDGPYMANLRPGESINVVQDQTRASDSVPFHDIVVSICLKALDLPLSFYREDFSNWFGSRAAMNHFERAARPKRRQLMETLNEIVKWRLGMAIFDGEIQLPASMSFEDIRWKWLPESFGWYDPVSEITAYRAAVASGFMSPIDVCDQTGTDWRRNLADKVTYVTAHTEAGMPPDFAMGSSSSQSIGPEAETPEDEPSDEEPDEEMEDDEEDDTDSTR